MRRSWLALLPLLLLPSAARADWRMDEFMISLWGAPQDDATAEAIVDAGFNTVMCGLDGLDLCRRHGLKAIIRGADPELAARMTEDPVVWGWYVQDEPKEEQFAAVGEQVAAFHEADPNHPAYVNLMAWMDLDKYLETVKPRFLSYDYYQWWWGPHNHFWRLEAHRAAALKAGIPLICWIEPMADGRWEMGERGQTYLPDNEPKIRQSVYTSLAYGVKGVQWFNSYLVFHHAAGRKMLTSRRLSGDDVAQLNAEMKAMGPTLVGLRSVNVFHTEPVPKNTLALPENSPVQVKGQSLTLGLFEDDLGAPYAMVVNRDIIGSEWAMVGFSGSPTVVEKLDRATGKWQRLPGEHRNGTLWVGLILRPGDGELLRLR